MDLMVKASEVLGALFFFLLSFLFMRLDLLKIFVTIAFGGNEFSINLLFLITDCVDDCVFELVKTWTVMMLVKISWTSQEASNWKEL
jgi:hypothetical protein